MNNLFKTTLILLISMVSLSVSARDHKGPKNDSIDQCQNREQFFKKQAQKIAQDLAFDDATTQKFIDKYCQCQNEVMALRAPGDKRDDKKRDENITEEVARRILQEQFTQGQELLNIRQKYYKEYSKFLTQKQILRIYKSEKKMKENMAERHGRPDKKEGPGPRKGQHKDKKPRQEAPASAE